jgi:hypothetical protein
MPDQLMDADRMAARVTTIAGAAAARPLIAVPEGPVDVSIDADAAREAAVHLGAAAEAAAEAGERDAAGRLEDLAGRLSAAGWGRGARVRP